MKVHIGMWVATVDTLMREEGLSPGEMDLDPEKIVNLGKNFDVMVQEEKGTTYVTLDEKGRRFSLR
jgi:hypothetical protein